MLKEDIQTGMWTCLGFIMYRENFVIHIFSPLVVNGYSRLPSFHCLLHILVFWSCHLKKKKNPQIWWIRTIETYLFTVLKAKSPKFSMAKLPLSFWPELLTMSLQSLPSASHCHFCASISLLLSLYLLRTFMMTFRTH